jgi:hypothetical protein
VARAVYADPDFEPADRRHRRARRGGEGGGRAAGRVARADRP